MSIFVAMRFYNVIVNNKYKDKRMLLELLLTGIIVNQGINSVELSCIVSCKSATGL